MVATYVKTGGSWKEVTGLYVKSGGAWKTVANGYVKEGGAWKKFFERAVEVTISSSQEEVDLATMAQANGWDGVSEVVVNCTINSGVVIGTPVVNTSRPAFEVSGFPEGSELNLTNNGTIVGKFGAASGGHGGHALKVRSALNLTNNGIIAGGGGGGGDGSDDSCTYYQGDRNQENGICRTNYLPFTCNASGGNGGRGAGWHSTGSFYSAGASGSSGVTNECDGLADPADGTCVGESCTAVGEDGGKGGNLGVSGNNSGGIRGRAVDGHSYVNYVVTGTIRGSQVN